MWRSKKFIVTALLIAVVLVGSIAGGVLANEDEEETPTTFCLYPGRPNPFNSVTSIRYDLPEAAYVGLEVFNVSGRLVRRLIDHRLREPGRHYIVWNRRNDKGRPVGPGIYFCRLSAGSETQIQRIILLR